MIFKASSLLLALLCTLLVLAALADGAGPAPPPARPNPNNPRPNNPKPNNPNRNNPQQQGQRPLPKIPELPLPKGITEEDASSFAMGKYEENQKVLFASEF
jgi:hypothetical protein